jgi:streptogramin lyase
MQIRCRWLFSFVVSLLLAACLSAQSLTEFALLEGARPGRIVAGPDGNLWFTDRSDPPRIGRMTPAGEVALFPSGARRGFAPFDIAAGADGNGWATYLDIDDNGSINRMTPRGEHSEFLSAGGPIWITAGPDGNLWFSQVSGAIGRMTTGGQLTNFPLPNGTVPGDITVGADGNLWFTHHDRTRIGRITPGGVVTGEFLTPTRPNRLRSGPDGNLWFTQWDADRIGRMTTSGAVADFAIPGRAYDLVAGPDGHVWFTYWGANRIGRITTDGVLVGDITIPSPATGLTVGSDGSVWFTQQGAGRIGRITLAHQPAIDSRILPVVGSTVGVGGSFFRTAVQIHNPTSEQMTGRLVFHPSGDSGASLDPSLLYSLSPGQTQSIADLLPAMGRSGLGSADIDVTSGHVPTMTVRVFNDAGAAGTLGFTEEPMRAADALTPQVSGALLVPADPTRFRFNLGVRTLEAESTATLTLRDASGAIVKTVSREFPATFHEQRSAGEFLEVSTLPAGGSIGISMTSGSAIFYGATVDNTTGDPSLQVARPAPLR